MLRTTLIAGSCVIALATGSALAQQPPPAPPAATQPEVDVVGLPVYSNDGQKLGQVTEVGTFGGQRMLRAEIGAFLGIGQSPVLIPTDMFAHKGDRIEVAMSGDEVRETVARQKKPPQ